MSPRVGRGDLIVRAKHYLAGIFTLSQVEAYLANTEQSLERGCNTFLLRLGPIQKCGGRFISFGGGGRANIIIFRFF